jgi:two-component system cell cycle sensor histidine kinase/response regulator CckA
MKTEYKIIVLSILLGLFLWVADAALDYFIYYQGTFWGLLIYEIPPHEIYARTLVLGCCVVFGVAIHTVFGKFRRAEEKQRESEKQLRLAVKNSRDVLYKLNLRTGDFDYVSPSVVELGGYTPQEFILLGVKGLLRRIDPEDRHRFMLHFRNVLRQAVEDGLAPTIEYRWKHKEGEYRWFSDNRAVVRDDDGNPVSLIGSVRDVTEQKEAEWALRESEAKYRTLIETAQEGIGITSPGEEFVFVNRAFASILGYEPSELVGRNLREFVTEEGFETFQMETGKREWGTSGRYETEMRHRDGSHRSLLVSASAIYDREGNYNGTLGMVVDITERKRAEESLRESEEKLDAMLQSIGDHMSMMDEDLNILWANEVAKKLFGNDIIGKKCYEVYHQRQEPCEPYPCLTLQAFRDGKAHEHDTQVIDKDGRMIYFHCKANVALRDKDGKPTAVIEISSDITERKKAEETLRETTNYLDNLIEHANAPIIVWAPGFKITRFNRAFEHLTGYTAKEVIGQELSLLFPEGSREESLKKIEHTVSGEYWESVEIAILRKDGDTRVALWNSANIYAEDGKTLVSTIAQGQDITERKRAEEALRESRDYLEKLTNSMWDAVFSVRMPERVIEWASDSFRLLGYEPHKCVGRTTEFLYPDKSEYLDFGNKLTEVIAAGKNILHVERRLKRKNGELFPAEIVTTIFAEKGEVVRVTSIVRDITERKRAEEAILRERDKAQKYLDIAGVMIVAIDALGEVTLINKRGCEILGYEEQEIISKNWFDNFLPAQARDELKAVSRRLLAGEIEPVEYYENPILTKNGDERLIAWHNIALRDQQGKIIGHLSSGEDITERKKAEEAIQQSEEKHRRLVENLPQKIFYKDRDSIYVSCNKNYASDLKIKPDEIAGKTDYDFYPKELAEKYRADDRRLMESGETEHIEERYIEGGKELTVHTVKTPVRDEEGNVVGILGIFWDITEQRSLEAQLRQSQKMESLGTLAGGVAHDFNNLLGGILGYVGLIKGDYSAEDKHYAMLELVEKASVRAAELTNQLLAFSRKGKYELRAVDLNNSVEDVLKLIGRTLDKKIEIITELQEELPSVEGDPGQLEQAIINLCVNAAEATPGGGKLQLETRVVALEEEFARKYLGSDARDYVLLSVSDTGIGMDSETLSRMFEPFFTTKEVGKGTGLGLSTVYGIVKNHGGYVDVRSQPGKGSTFDVYLPASKEQLTAVQPPTSELKAGRETILAVDDEEIIRSLLEETLKKLGYKVILANDGEEAVQIYEKKKDEIDAVIIDMIMPRVGGCEAFRELKRRNPGVKVLLATGYSQDGTAQQILDEGVKGFIQKPFELVELSQKLRQILD